jgi:hypothetical protein
VKKKPCKNIFSITNNCFTNWYRYLLLEKLAKYLFKIKYSRKTNCKEYYLFTFLLYSYLKIIFICITLLLLGICRYYSFLIYGLSRSVLLEFDNEKFSKCSLTFTRQTPPSSSSNKYQFFRLTNCNYCKTARTIYI